MFLLNFIDEDSLQIFQNNKTVENLRYEGEQMSSINVKETVIIDENFTDMNNVFNSVDEVLNFLSYGYNPKIETYVTKKYDTVQGVAVIHGMNHFQIVSLNRNLISDKDQILSEGMNLKVSKYNSPLTVEVVKERLVEEIIIRPDRLYIQDSKLPEGEEVVEIIGQDGVVENRYFDTYINGESVDSKLIYSNPKTQPVQEVIRVGTYTEPKLTSGVFGWPLNNAYVLCGWACYPGHKRVDFSVRGSGYGPIIASDGGVIIEKGYDGSGWGFYTKIDHENGFATLYAHMEAPGYYNIGDRVSKGDTIGYVGMTGRTTYPHVHFEVYDKGVRINGCIYLNC